MKIKAESNPSQYKTPDSFTEEELYNAIRQDLMAELDAINLYEAHKAATKDKELQKILEHIISEEKDHVKLLQDYLKEHDQWEGGNPDEEVVSAAFEHKVKEKYKVRAEEDIRRTKIR